LPHDTMIWEAKICTNCCCHSTRL